MSRPEHVIKLIKFMVGEATAEELDFLASWIKEPENQKVFDAYVKLHFESTAVMSKPDVDRIKRTLLKRIKKDRNPFTNGSVVQILKYAAVVALVFGLGYLFKEVNTLSGTEGTVAEQQKVIPKEDAITIQLEDGSIATLNTNESKNIHDAKGNRIGTQQKTQMTYQRTEAMSELRYHTLHVPRGKQFDVVLSDGSHVYLNSGSTLKFPVQFLEGKPRNVVLHGEAYFDIAEDTERPFTVEADAMNIQVLGTKFNVNHYPENSDINTVLVEGSVKLFGDGQQNAPATILQPGYKAEWNKKDGQISTKNVDTRLYTAWLDGKLIFRNATFKSIRYALERHYNVTIKNQNTMLDEQRFDATFDIETINEILESFSKSYSISYKIRNNEVHIE